MIRRHFLKAAVAVAALAGVAGTAHAADLKEINFGIISTESSSNLKNMFEPFLAGMAKQTGRKINAFFAPDYAGVIEGMRSEARRVGKGVVRTFKFRGTT